MKPEQIRAGWSYRNGNCVRRVVDICRKEFMPGWTSETVEVEVVAGRAPYVGGGIDRAGRNYVMALARFAAWAKHEVEPRGVADLVCRALGCEPEQIAERLEELRLHAASWRALAEIVDNNCGMGAPIGHVDVTIRYLPDRKLYQVEADAGEAGSIGTAPTMEMAACVASIADEGEALLVDAEGNLLCVECDGFGCVSGEPCGECGGEGRVDHRGRGRFVLEEIVSKEVSRGRHG